MCLAIKKDRGAENGGEVPSSGVSHCLVDFVE